MTPLTPTSADEEKQTAPNREPNSTTVAPDRAELIVELPPDARLYIHDQLTRSTSGQRCFVSPRLAPNQDYWYRLRMEVVRDGKVRTEEREVAVKAGEVAAHPFQGLGRLDRGGEVNAGRRPTWR